MSSARELMQSKAVLGGAFGRPAEETLHNYWVRIISAHCEWSDGVFSQHVTYV
jgi:hypothetical protein